MSVGEFTVSNIAADADKQEQNKDSKQAAKVDMDKLRHDVDVQRQTAKEVRHLPLVKAGLWHCNAAADPCNSSLQLQCVCQHQSQVFCLPLQQQDAVHIAAAAGRNCRNCKDMQRMDKTHRLAEEYAACAGQGLRIARLDCRHCLMHLLR